MGRSHERQRLACDSRREIGSFYSQGTFTESPSGVAVELKALHAGGREFKSDPRRQVKPVGIEGPDQWP